MKKMIKKTSALAISAFMLAQYVPFSAVARDSDKNDLFIHPYILNQDDYDTAEGQKASKPPTGKTADNNNVPGTNSVNTSMKFDIIQVDSDGSDYSGTPVSLTNVSAVATTASGSSQASATNLPNGYYKITPAGKTDTDARFRDAEAFIIQLPVPDGAGVNRDVHIYPKYTNNNDNDSGTTNPGQETPTSGDTHHVTLTKTEVGSNPTVYVSNANYDLYYKDAAGKWVKGAVTYTTDASGQIIVTGLPLGDYYFVETTPVPTGYMLDQTPLGFTINGTTAATVSAYNEKELSVDKDIAYDAAGNTYNWVIKGDIPDDPTKLSAYTITDTYSTAALQNVAVSSVKVGTNTLLDTDYNVSAITTSGTNSSFTITFTSDGLAKLDKNGTVTTVDVTVSSKIVSGYTAASVSNKASVAYTYGATSTGPVIPVTPPPTNYPTGTDPIEDEKTVTLATLIISNTGSGELAGATYKIEKVVDDTTSPITVASISDDFNNLSDDGNLATPNKDKVVVANLAPGAYKITQTGIGSAASDHLLNDTPRYIYVGDNGTIYESDKTTAIADDGVTNQVQFANTSKGSFNLPFTGTTATIVFSITGILLMAGTAFFIFIILKKRDDDEEEQENN